MWHEASEPYRRDGRLAVAGIVQEQHGDRAALFMQWKDMGWPVMVDALNRLGVGRVPIVLLIDEHGIVREINPKRRPAAALEAFLQQQFEPADDPAPALDPAGPTRLADTEAALLAEETLSTLLHRGSASFLWGGDEQLDSAIAVFRRASLKWPESGAASFRLGVALRRRHEGGARSDGDFQAAVDAWSAALRVDPNQYIWRRRIQQYGPRLDKPYPFYDWVRTARTELIERGITPAPLAVEPLGAEFAHPLRELASTVDERPPDPHGRITADEGFVRAEVVVVPETVPPGGSARIHLVLRPQSGHWNNEAEPLRVWIDPPPGCRVDRRLHVVGNADRAISSEMRAIDFELQVPADATATTLSISGYALYNVCRDADAACLFRRLPIEATVGVTSP